jgi:hypothetical protein
MTQIITLYTVPIYTTVHWFYGAISKWRKGLLASSCMSVFLSVLREQLRFQWTYFNKTRYQYFPKFR